MCASRIAVSLGVGWSILVASPVRATEPMNLGYVSKDAIGAIVLKPRSLLTDPKLDLLPHEIIVAACQENFGVDPRQIDSAVALVGLGRLPDGPPGLGLILRFREPYHEGDFVSRLGSKAVQKEHEGKKYWTIPDGSPEPLAAAAPDEKTLLLGTEPQLRSMLVSHGVDTTLTRLIKDSPPAPLGGVILFDFEAVRPMILAQMEGMPPAAAPLRPFLELPRLIRSVKFTLNLEPFNVAFSVKANDPAAAQRIKSIAETAKVMIRAMIEQQVASMAPAGGFGDSQTAKATSQYLRRLSKAQLDSLQFVADGDEVRLEVQANALPYVAVAGVGTAIMLPAIQAARQAAQRTMGRNNLKQIGLALHNYHVVHGRFPARAVLDKASRPTLSWRVAILPYLEEEGLYRQFHLDEPWDSEHNRKLVARMPRIYQNPQGGEPGKTVYLGIVGDGAFFNDKGVRLADVLDGSSNTVAVVEADADRAVPWTKPDDLAFHPKQPTAGLGRLWNGGFNALFADGSVRFFNVNVDPNVLRALTTINGREELQLLQE